MPSANRAATQKARVVTAIFISQQPPNAGSIPHSGTAFAELQRAGGTAGGADPVPGGTASTGAGGGALTGIFNFWPTTILLTVFKLLASAIALAVIPYFLAMTSSRSPDLTT